MVRVVSCRFMRLSCSEDDHPLFRRYYARSNRERGVKLLRCFPHCCPEHVQRCYCGSSIHVQVTFTSELPLAAQGTVIVCARFEPSRVVPLWPTNLADTPEHDGGDDHERKLQPGEIVSLPESVLLPKSRQAKQTLWIRADREGESKQTTKNATLYVLNNHRFPKWLYSYDSSITRTQREMTHHLVVYVFQLTGNRSQCGEIDAAVLARHESPGFSLVSYRRSGNNASDAGCDLPAVEASSSSKFAAVDVDTPHVLSSPSDDMEIDSYDQTPCDLPREHAYNKDSKLFDTPQQQYWEEQRRPYAKQQWRLQYPSQTPTFDCISLNAAAQESRNNMKVIGDSIIGIRVSAGAAEEDELLWQKEAEVREPGFREKTQHLIILWRFLQHVSFSDLKFSPETVETHIHSHWLLAAAALRSAPINLNAQLEDIVASFLSNVFESNSPRSKHANFGENVQDLATIRTSVFLFLRVLSSRSIQHLFHEACQGTNKEWLRKRFISLILDLYDILDDVLCEMSASIGVGGQNLSLATLVDNILSLIYGRTSFSVLRDEVSSLLLDRQTPSSTSGTLNEVLRTFTVQAHEFSTAQHRQSNQQYWSGGELHSAWSHRWLLDPGSVHLIAVDNDTKREAQRDASFVAIAQLVQEFGCVDITIAQGESICMSLRTALPFDGVMEMAPMKLVLDGRMRGFCVLPSGISSVVAMAGGWSIEDYEAILSDDGHCLNIHFFAFVKDNTVSSRTNQLGGQEGVLETKVRRVSLSFVLEQEMDAKNLHPRDRFIIVHGTVYSSIVRRAGGRPKISATSSADRSAVWNELKWTPLFEVQAGYVAL